MTYKERRNHFGFKCHDRSSKPIKPRKQVEKEYKVVRSDGVSIPYVYRLKVDANAVAMARAKDLPENSTLTYDVIRIK